MAVFGGTFDPVHYGHLRSAVEVRDALQLQTVKLVPSYQPPHREAPGSSAEQRLDMVRIAARESGFLEVDDREIRRGGKSFMIDTLRSIRRDIGDAAPLVLVLGDDAFALLETWHEWRSLLEVAHIAVLARPGSHVDENLSTELANLVSRRLVERPLCLHSKPGGQICILRLTQLDISSTRIREMLGKGESVAYLMPSEVLTYITEHGLYASTST